MFLLQSIFLFRRVAEHALATPSVAVSQPLGVASPAVVPSSLSVESSSLSVVSSSLSAESSSFSVESSSLSVARPREVPEAPWTRVLRKSQYVPDNSRIGAEASGALLVSSDLRWRASNGVICHEFVQPQAEQWYLDWEGKIHCKDHLEDVPPGFLAPVEDPFKVGAKLFQFELCEECCSSCYCCAVPLEAQLSLRPRDCCHWLHLECFFQMLNKPVCMPCRACRRRLQFHPAIEEFICVKW